VSNEALMRAYLAGDTRAFSALFQRLAPAISGFFRRSFDAATADDLLQQTFLKAHRARATYLFEKPVKPWVFAIAGRVRIDEYRRRTRTPEDGDDDAVLDEPNKQPLQDKQLDDLRREAGLQDAISQLPEAQRQVLHLHYFEDLSFAEIATALGTTEGACKLRAFRGYERLRQVLVKEAT
jgi:RNA polymerase sigma factor (sigma-70 family)